MENTTSIPTSFEKWGQPGHFSSSLKKNPGTTKWIWDFHADVHDFSAFSSLTNSRIRSNNAARIFSAHFGHLGIVFIWLSGLFYHGAKFSNYERWLTDPIHIKPGSQVVWDIFGQNMLNADLGDSFQGIQTTSGVFHVWRSWGILSGAELYWLSVGGLICAGLCFVAGWFHYHVGRMDVDWFQNAESMINHHLTGLLGLGSLAWTGHLIHVSLPIETLLESGVDPKEIPAPYVFLQSNQLMSTLYPSFAKGLEPFFTLNWSEYSDFLTFKGGLNPSTQSLWLTDIIHHHLAISIVFLIAGHLYRTNWKYGLQFKEILDSHKGPFTGRGHEGLLEFLNGSDESSWHAQLAINLAFLGSLSILISHHMASMPAYPFIAMDWATQVSLFTHHCWIGGFCIVGAGAHASIAFVRTKAQTPNNLLDRVIKHREAILSHLSWVCIFLGFHSFGLFVHNDTMSALGRPEDMFSDTALQLQPVFAQWIQSVAVSVSTLSTQTDGSNPIIVSNLGTTDFLMHHIHAFTIHVTVLILLKGVLFSRSSRLIPDKASLGFRFPCDGPGRGGTCQVSGWDHVFLGLFWMYNRISIVIFHFLWKMQSDVWGVTNGNFAASANTVNGWLRDFLWAQSSQVIQSYGSPLSAYGILFLGGHFIWAFRLMFLFSGRGYWMELIESILWMHNKLNVTPSIQPRALSITQGRAVGVAHFLLGGIATTWSFFLARTLSIS
jgi:photosystem I P700 chlorophyll a apoprotein A1